MERLSFYTLSQEYAEYLREFDSRIPFIHEDKKRRPFVGVLLKVNNHNFYAPLSSPKPKHLLMKDSIDFQKINKGEYGVINLNNMIPVSLKSLAKINLSIYSSSSKEDLDYKELLNNQLEWCNVNEKKIIAKASKLYRYFKLDKLPPNIKNRCCDFVLLEEKLELYKKEKGW